VNPFILKEEVQEFLKENQSKDVRAISLMKSPFSDVSAAELAQQIKGRQIAKYKFPFFLENEKVFYPPSLNLEQSSSWPTSQYKATLVQGKTLIDLTAGMGIDALGFAQKFEKVTALERNSDLVEISRHNYQVLGQENLEYQNTEFQKYLDENPDLKWDVIYLDPARRKDSQKKFILEDLEPNILEWMDIFLQKADTVFIKLSPLLDLKLVIEQIPQIQEIHLVAFKNEMKELLLICKKEFQKDPLIKAVNLETQQPDFSFHFQEESQSNVQFSDPQKFLYEPNVAVLKSGAFKLVSEKLNLNKLHVNSHLYTSEVIVESFPGKVYEILEEVKNPKKEIKNQSFHVISKNYPMTVDLIRKKYNLKESEEQSLIFTQTESGKYILKAKRIR
jgi:16S rRNA G966 N2-methylase RsmD